MTGQLAWLLRSPARTRTGRSAWAAACGTLAHQNRGRRAPSCLCTAAYALCPRAVISTCLDHWSPGTQIADPARWVGMAFTPSAHAAGQTASRPVGQRSGPGRPRALRVTCYAGQLRSPTLRMRESAPGRVHHTARPPGALRSQRRIRMVATGVLAAGFHLVWLWGAASRRAVSEGHGLVAGRPLAMGDRRAALLCWLPRRSWPGLTCSSTRGQRLRPNSTRRSSQSPHSPRTTRAFSGAADNAGSTGRRWQRRCTPEPTSWRST